MDYFQNATRLVNKKINSKAQIINFAPEYFTKLTKLVKEYNKTVTGKMYVYHARCMPKRWCVRFDIFSVETIERDA